MCVSSDDSLGLLSQLCFCIAQFSDLKFLQYNITHR